MLATVVAATLTAGCLGGGGDSAGFFDALFGGGSGGGSGSGVASSSVGAPSAGTAHGAEPSTVALVGGGLAFAAWRRRARRKHRKA